MPFQFEKEFAELNEIDENQDPNTFFYAEQQEDHTSNGNLDLQGLLQEEQQYFDQEVAVHEEFGMNQGVSQVHHHNQNQYLVQEQDQFEVYHQVPQEYNQRQAVHQELYQEIYQEDPTVHHYQPDGSEKDPLEEFFPELAREEAQRSLQQTVQQEEYPVVQPMPQASQAVSQPIPQQVYQVVQPVEYPLVQSGSQSGYQLIDNPVVQPMSQASQPVSQPMSQQVFQAVYQHVSQAMSISQQRPQVKVVSVVNIFCEKQRQSLFGDLLYLAEFESDQNLPQRTFSINNGFIVPPPFPIDIQLTNMDLWTQLRQETNEMMVTNQGRSLFPRIGFSIRNMNPDCQYVLGLRLYPTSENRFEFRSKWVEVEGTSKPEESNEMFSVPKWGAELMENGFVFTGLKIFNIGDEVNKTKHLKKEKMEESRKQLEMEKMTQMYIKQERFMLKVETKRMYQPLVTIYQVSPTGVMTVVQSTPLPEAEFITSAGYKNDKMREMKTMTNKHATKKEKKKKREKASAPSNGSGGQLSYEEWSQQLQNRNLHYN